MKKEQLQMVAEEFNELFGLEPKIDVNQSEKKLLKEVKETMSMKEPEDEFTEGTLAILSEIEEMGKEKEKTIPEEKEEVVSEEIDLYKEIEEAKILKDLRKIAKGNKEFKNIRGSLIKWKTVMTLQDVMLDVLDKLEDAKETPKKQDKIPETSINKVPPKKETTKKETTKKEIPKKEIVKKEDKKEVKVKKEVEKITRPKAIGLALQKKPKTFSNWVEQANEIYTNSGGLSNINKIKADINYMYPTFIVLGVELPKK